MGCRYFIFINRFYNWYLVCKNSVCCWKGRPSRRSKYKYKSKDKELSCIEAIQIYMKSNVIWDVFSLAWNSCGY